MMLPSLVYVIKVYDFISTFVNPMIKKLDSLVNQKHIRYMVGDNDFTTTKSSDKCFWVYLRINNNKPSNHQMWQEGRAAFSDLTL